MEQANFTNSSLQADLPQTNSNSVLRPHIKNVLDKLQRELSEVKATTYGRPIRYYDAYRAYTLYFNINVLEGLIHNSTDAEKESIGQLLNEYYATTN